jgi:hypothetical protein
MWSNVISAHIYFFSVKTETLVWELSQIQQQEVEAFFIGCTIKYFKDNYNYKEDVTIKFL